MTAAAPVIRDTDRLGATLALSLVFHGVLVLGVGFALSPAAPIVPTLDVILARTHTPEPPKDADFLAQASQQGGGETERPDRPAEPQLAPVPKPELGVAPVPLEAATPVPRPAAPETVIAATRPPTAQAAPRKPEVQEMPLPTSRELIEQTLEMARLAAEIEQRREAYAKRPKRKFISASTREYELAAYMRGWVARVERIGNLNYPDEARRRNLAGQLVMTVAIRRDGSVERIDVVQPSGSPVLDDAARRIVELSAPFAPIPETRDAIDILHITRTWQFLEGGVLRNR